MFSLYKSNNQQTNDTMEAARDALLHNPKNPDTMRNRRDVPPTEENQAHAALLAKASSGGRRKNTKSHNKRRRGGKSSKRMRRTCRK